MTMQSVVCGNATRVPVLMVCIVLAVLLTGCSRRTPGTPTTTGQPDTTAPAAQLPAAVDAPMHGWPGVYSFEEVWDTEGQDIRNVITYELDVRQQGDSLVAEFNADGYMTSIHLHCTAIGDKDHLVVVFKEAGEDNMFDQAGEGETLFTLVRKDESLLTFWGVLEPQALELEDGTPYFKKDTIPVTHPSNE